MELPPASDKEHTPHNCIVYRRSDYDQGARNVSSRVIRLSACQVPSDFLDDCLLPEIAT
jgi:hypothetical protein